MSSARRGIQYLRAGCAAMTGRPVDPATTLTDTYRILYKVRAANGVSDNSAAEV